MANGIQVLLGVEGVKSVYERSLNEKELAIMCMSSGYEAVLGDYFDMEYAPRLYDKVRTREILPDTVENRDYAKGKDQKVDQVKFAQVKPTETDLLIGKDWAARISFDASKPMAVVIEEKELVEAMRQEYELMWEVLKR